MSVQTEKKEENREFRRPLVDVYETDSDVVLQFELPGVEADAIEVGVDADTLKVETKAAREPSGHGRQIVSEFEPADFYREFILSRDLDRENIVASWNNGVLTLKVGKQAAATHKIEIEAHS